MGAADRRERNGFEPCAADASRGWLSGWLVLAGVTLSLALSAAPAMAIDCATPDSLCKGNPCVTGTLEVTSPCVLDFGDRALVIRGTLKVPNGGVLSLKAGSIDVRRPIIGRKGRRYADGASITLTAIRDLSVRWRIDASGRSKPGRIELDAGGNVNVLAPLRAATKGSGASATGGSVIINAGGKLVAAGRARIRTNGAATTTGGTVILNGANGVDMQNRITSFGRDGGSVSVSAGAGDVMFARRIDVSGIGGDGGSVTVSAPGGDIALLDRVDAEGTAQGGSLSFIGGGRITAFGALRAGSMVRTDLGGSITIVGNDAVGLGDVVAVDGSSGGFVLISSEAGALSLTAPVVATGTRDGGGRVSLVGGGSATIGNAVDADGAIDGGTINISGGAVTLTNSGGLFARGENGGTINVAAESVTVAAGARVLVDGDLPGGRIRFDASAGDLVLDGDFRARGRTGGRIEGTASNDVVATGDFAARGGGCIGLSAGSTLDTSGGIFDVAVVDMCP